MWQKKKELNVKCKLKKCYGEKKIIRIIKKEKLSKLKDFKLIKKK